MNANKDSSGKYKKRSPAMQVWRRLLRSKPSVFSLAFLVLLFVLSLFANFLIDESLVTFQDPNALAQAPSAAHWFGTDIYGRDVFTRVVYGARISLTIGVVTILVATTIGGLLGAVAAYFGGLVDDIIMRMTDIFMAIPETLLAMCVVSAAGASATSLIIALVVAIVPNRCRLVRSTVLGIAGREYVEAAKAAGMSSFKIILTQVLPNSIGPVIVVSTQGVANMMLTAASLSYLGLGIQPPNPEWGAIIAAAREYLRIYPYMCVIPGIVILLTALSFNLLGDGLRDALDPRLKD